MEVAVAYFKALYWHPSRGMRKVSEDPTELTARTASGTTVGFCGGDDKIRFFFLEVEPRQ
jgi:hypothetical protein